MDDEQAGKKSLNAPSPLAPCGTRPKSMNDILETRLPLCSFNGQLSSSSSEASFFYPFDHRDSPKSLKSVVKNPLSVSPPANLEPQLYKEIDPTVHDLKKHVKNRLSLAPAEHLRSARWYVPCPKMERSLPFSPNMPPSLLELQGFLGMWRAKKYEPVWVTFDGKTLSVYEGKKSHFSKFFLTMASIKVVVEKDDTKFSVSTERQELIFGDIPAVERDRWVRVLRHSMTVQPTTGHPILGENVIKKSGNLILKASRSKVYMAVTNVMAVMFNSIEDFIDGLGILSIAMNIVKVKKSSRNNLEVITPHRTFCFITSSEAETVEWVDVMSGVATDSHCSDEVAKRIWSLPENRLCADCESPQPEWVSVNLVAVICSSCAGQHRSLGTNISNVKGLRVDIAIWTEPLIQLLIRVGNKGASELWAHNVPPSERITSDSLPEDRHRFIYAKYREGKYRRFHPLFGEQFLLNEALCQSVLSDDSISETMLLVFSGAQVTCRSSQLGHPTPIALAEEAGQLMQLEFLKLNEYKDTPYPDPVLPLTPSPPEKTSKKGLRKSAFQDHLPIQLQGSKLCFYRNGSQEMTYSVELQEIMLLARCPLGKWVEIRTTKAYIREDTTPEKARQIYQLIAQEIMALKGLDVSVVEMSERMTLSKVFEDGSPEGQEAWALLKLKDIVLIGAKLKETCAFSTIQDVSFNVEEHLMNIQTANRDWELEFLSPPEFNHWCSVLCDITSPPNMGPKKVIKKGKELQAASPAISHCLQHLNQHGLLTVGIYRQCARKCRLNDLLSTLKRKGTNPTLKLNSYTVHEVAGALKQLLRDMDSEELFTEDHSNQLMQATEVREEPDRTALYRTILDFIPIQNKLFLKALFMHLNAVHNHSSLNKMTASNLATVFAPTLFLSCLNLQDSTRLVHDFIIHCPVIFNVT